MEGVFDFLSSPFRAGQKRPHKIQCDSPFNRYHRHKESAITIKIKTLFKIFVDWPSGCPIETQEAKQYKVGILKKKLISLSLSTTFLDFVKIGDSLQITGTCNFDSSFKRMCAHL